MTIFKYLDGFVDLQIGLFVVEEVGNDFVVDFQVRSSDLAVTNSLVKNVADGEWDETGIVLGALHRKRFSRTRLSVRKDRPYHSETRVYH